jgi:xanthine dehydrogenase YagR molybdenum-binding subunit
MNAPSVGQPVERKDGIRKVTGTASYASDVKLPRMAYAATVRSTIAAGRITGIDARAALAAPGVMAVITHENAPRLHSPGSAATGGEFAEKFFPVQNEQIHYWGQYVAVVVGLTPDQAEAGARRLRVDYAAEPFQLELDPRDPAAEHPLFNLGDQKAQIHRGHFDQARREAGVIVEQTYRTPYLHHHPMEPHATVADWTEQRLTIYEPTQWVMGLRSVVSKSFDLPATHVHVISPFVGGGFGSKGFGWPHTLLAAMASRHTGRPVRLVLTREEMFTSVGHRGPTRQELVLAADETGRLTGLRHETLTPTSVKGSFFETSGLVSAMLYECPNVEIIHRVARLNTGAPTPMRAPGESTGTFALESVMDELAVKLGLDPIELRVRNHAAKDPGKDEPWSSKHLLECYRRGAELFGWAQRNPRPGSRIEEGELVGWGMATATYPAARRKSAAAVRAYPDGRVVVRAATQDLGTGTYTTLAQVAADELGVPVAQVSCEIGDSQFPPGNVSGGSSTTASMGPVVQAAARKLRQRLGEGGQRTGEAAKRVGEHKWAEAFRGLDEPFLEAKAESSASSDRPGVSLHSFGSQFAEVRVNRLTRMIRVSRVVTVIDGGRIMNPLTARSQIQGGVVWGIGMALLERTEFDARTASPVTRNLADYLVPVNADVPELTVEFLDYPDLDFNALGARGIGEIGITGITAAIANAVYHATGVRVRELPITLDRLLV